MIEKINMKTLMFKTSINCGGCLASITPALDSLTGITKWHVDLNSPERTLEVITDTLTEQEIIDIVQKNGFDIDVIRN